MKIGNGTRWRMIELNALPYSCQAPSPYHHLSLPLHPPPSFCLTEQSSFIGFLFVRNFILFMLQIILYFFNSFYDQKWIVELAMETFIFFGLESLTKIVSMAYLDISYSKVWWYIISFYLNFAIKPTVWNDAYMYKYFFPDICLKKRK